MKRLAIMMVLLLSLTLVGIINAQEGTEDPRENACYTGGDLAGKCSNWDTEEEIKWAWNCGYYYASYISGKISLEETPETCKILFETIEQQSLSLCIYLGDDEPTRIEAGEYIWIVGFPNTQGNATLYSYFPSRDTSPCDELEPDEIPVIWMQTPGYVGYIEALNMCNEADSSIDWNAAFQLSHPAIGGFNWFCTVQK